MNSTSTPLHRIGSDPAHDPARSTSRWTELTALISEPSCDRTTNLLRLQGWRDDDLTAAAQMPAIAHRIGPAVCGGLALAVAATGSGALLSITLATSIVGVFARNHPVETAYNTLATRFGRRPMPANRAAKRLGCAIGSLFLGAAGVAMWLGFTTVATVLSGALGSLALFVAVTGICVPSIISTLTFGASRGTRRRLIGR